MKLQVTQENLSRALNTVARVANTRNTLPILANVLLKTIDNRLSVSATNLDIGITHFIGGKISKPGSITVPARLTQDFVTSLPDSVINLELTDNKLHIVTEKYNSVINGIAADEFPVMPEVGKGISWRVPARDFKKALSQTVLAASGDDARPVLTGVYFHSDGKNLVLAATDSYRLAEKSIGKNTKEINLIVPATAIHDLLRVIGDSNDELLVVHDDQQIIFKTSDVSLVARLIDGTYPDYRKLLPTKFDVVARLKKEDFLGITKVSSLFARESAGSVTVKVEDGKVSINSIASQLGENTATADAEINGEGEITINSRYLIDGLNAFDADVVEFCFNGKLEPSILRDPNSPNYTHLIMPLRS